MKEFKAIPLPEFKLTPDIKKPELLVSKDP